jgi:hypothetical protein
MIEWILLLQANLDIQAACERDEAKPEHGNRPLTALNNANRSRETCLEGLAPDG